MEKVSLNTPKNTVAAVPALLGFEPDNSIVTLFMTDNAVRLTTRIDSDILQESGALGEVIFALSEQHDFTSFITIHFGEDDAKFREVAQELEDFCESEDGPALIDAIQVWGDGRFVSTISPEAEIEQITDKDRESNSLAMLRVVNGDNIAKSRDDVVKEISLGDGSADEYVSAVESAAVRFEKPLSDFRRENYRFAMEVLDQPEPKLDDILTLGIMSRDDVKLRDGIVRHIAESKDPRPMRTQLIRAARLMAERDAPPLLTMIGVASFLSGDGLRASVAFEKALEIDPEYTLADLLFRSVHAAMPPDVWRSLILSIPEDKTLGV